MPVAKIVEHHGWDYFREYEAKIAQAVANISNTVIATGGGFVLQQNNIDALKKNGTFIFLQAPIEKLLERIGDDANRAALTDKKTKHEEMEEIWRQRKDLYEQAADIIMDTDVLNKKQITEVIIKKLKETL